MARRRAPRLTQAKKASTKKAEAVPLPPTKKEWDKMQPFGRFNVIDEDGNEFTFKVGDNALILPENCEGLAGLNEYQYWVGKIKDVRCRQQDGPDVWVFVQWYYSGQDAKGIIKSLHVRSLIAVSVLNEPSSDAASCSQYERILSDAYDYISSSSFEGVVKVKRYYEDSIEQSDIDDDDFFYRYELQCTLKRLNRLVPENESQGEDVISERPGANTCICKVPYNPANKSVLMHFCPRPSCRHWYHEKCLKGIKSFHTPSMLSSEASARLLYLSTSPFTGEAISLPTESNELSSPSAKRRRGGSGKSRTIIPVGDAQDSLPKQRLDSLPEELLLAAQQPIVKGRALGVGNLVGNIRMVVEARRAVYGVIDGEELTDDWDDLINSSAALVEDSLPLLLCPKCKSVI